MNASNLSRFLGFFSLGLGAAELLAGGRIAAAVGLPGRGGLVNAFGAREIGAGLAVLAAPTRPEPLWARIGGDVLDVAALSVGLSAPDRRGRQGALVALVAVLGVTLLDAVAARGLKGGPAA